MLAEFTISIEFLADQPNPNPSNVTPGGRGGKKERVLGNGNEQKKGGSHFRPENDPTRPGTKGERKKLRSEICSQMTIEVKSHCIPH